MVVSSANADVDSLHAAACSCISERLTMRAGQPGFESDTACPALHLFCSGRAAAGRGSSPRGLRPNIDHFANFQARSDWSSSVLPFSLQQAHVPEVLQPGVRVTLAMGDSPQPEPSPAGEGEVLFFMSPALESLDRALPRAASWSCVRVSVW